MGIAENLKMIRELNALSQSAVAKKLGITRQGYNHYETGKRVPPLDIMEMLCSIFGVSLNELTSGVGKIEEQNKKNSSKKNDAEELGAALKKICIDEGMITPDEELSDEFKEIATRLIRDAVILYKHSKKG